MLQDAPSRLLVVALILALPAIGCGDGSESTNTAPFPDHSGIPDPPREGEPAGERRLRTVYVPAYSQLPRGKEMEDRALLSILLSVRNVDSMAVVTLTHVDYFDTSGHRVRRYLDAPRQLRPLETAEFTVATQDDAGGSGANFLVYWEGPSDAHPLLTETMMVGNLGGAYVVFSSRGVELDRRPDPVSFTDELAAPEPATSDGATD